MTAAISHDLPYRPDIDGLRAWAVAAVVVYHAFPDRLKGGFVGVDVFFVISGYLITSLLLREIQAGRFSLATFYQRRVRRLFPALALVLCAALAAGWPWLLADEFVALGRSVLGGAFFVANLQFAQDTGYFDGEPATKPLLHLWSLGVEEQFYVVWPLLLAGVWRLGRARGVALGLLIAASFAANVWTTLHGVSESAGALNRQMAFYFPHTRFWELWVGAAVAAWAMEARAIGRGATRWREGLAWTGLGLLVLSVVAVDPAFAFPGYWALLPVVAAAFTLGSGPDTALHRRFWSHPLLVGLGRISYPLYLWHWLLLSLLHIVRGDVPAPEVRLIAVAASVLLAAATTHWLERPVRQRAATARLAFGWTAVVAATGLGGWIVMQAEGWPQRPRQAAFQQVAATAQKPTSASGCFDLRRAHELSTRWSCHFGAAHVRPHLFVFGDSHTLNVLPALEQLARDGALSFQFSGSSGCPPLLGLVPARGRVGAGAGFDCRALNERIYDEVKRHPVDAVLLVARWSYYTGGPSRPLELNPVFPVGGRWDGTWESTRVALAQGLRQTVERYHALGVRVLLLEDTPQQGLDPVHQALRRSALDDDSINAWAVTRDEHLRHQAVARDLLRAVRPAPDASINLDAALCDAPRCPLAADGRLLYTDDDHLSVHGSARLAPALRAALDAVLALPAPATTP